LYFERLSLYSIWFVVAIVNSVTAGKWGAGPSYFATAIAASCILSGIGFSRLLDWSQRRPELAWQWGALALVPLLFLLQASQMFHMPTHTPVQRAIAAALGQPTETVAP